MIRPAVAGALRHEFRDHAGEALFLRLQKMYVRDHERRQDEEEQAREADESLEAFATSMASLSEIADFRVDLDRYDVATVAALDANERSLSMVLKQHSALLAKAHVLDDGRHVFKTEDGTAVYDETGNAVTSVTVSPDLIRDDRPTWERFKPILDAKLQLETERGHLHAYQAKLDQARERLDAGDISRREFEQLRQTLKGDMPNAVREHVPELAEPSPSVVPRDGELEFSADVVPAGMRQYPALRSP